MCSNATAWASFEVKNCAVFARASGRNRCGMMYIESWEIPNSLLFPATAEKFVSGAAAPFGFSLDRAPKL
jgi:hypothetical protein